MAVSNQEGRNFCACNVGCRLMSRPWVACVLAVLELVLGFILLSFPLMLGLSAVWVSGFVLGVAGLVRLVQCIARREDRWWNLLAAILYLVVGVFTVLMPMLSMEWWTLFIGACLFTAGIMRMGVAIGMRRSNGGFWRFFNALISLVLGVMIIWGWPESSAWFIGTLIAVEMIFSGWTLMFLALAPRGETSENQ